MEGRNSLTTLIAWRPGVNSHSETTETIPHATQTLDGGATRPTRSAVQSSPMAAKNKNDNKTMAILLFAHGSRVEEANDGVRDLARQVEARGTYPYVRATFLELAEPNLGAAIAQAAEAGFRRVIVIPYFLTMGLHMRRDLPSLVAPEKQKHPDLEIEVGQSLEGHPLMASVILERVREVTRARKTAR
jgi:sirohydrochlorin ferrochelatase